METAPYKFNNVGDINFFDRICDIESRNIVTDFEFLNCGNRRPK